MLKCILIMVTMFTLFKSDLFAKNFDTITLVNDSELVQAKIENVANLTGETCDANKKGVLKFLTTQDGANLPGLYVCDGSDFSQAGGGGGSTDLSPTLLSVTQVKINKTPSEGSTSYFSGEKIILAADTTLTTGTELSSAPGSNFTYDLVYWDIGSGSVAVHKDIFIGTQTARTEAQIEAQAKTFSDIEGMALAYVEIGTGGVSTLYRARPDLNWSPNNFALKLSKTGDAQAEVNSGKRWLNSEREGLAADAVFNTDIDASFVAPDADEMLKDGSGTIKNYFYYDTDLNIAVVFAKSIAADAGQDDYAPEGSSRPDPKYIPLGQIDVDTAGNISAVENFPELFFLGSIGTKVVQQWVLSSADDAQADSDGFVAIADVDASYTHALGVNASLLYCQAWIKVASVVQPQECSGFLADIATNGITSTQLFTKTTGIPVGGSIKYSVYYFDTGNAVPGKSWSTCEDAADADNNCWISNSEASFASDKTFTHGKNMDKPICTVFHRTSSGDAQPKNPGAALQDITLNAITVDSTWTSLLNSGTDEYYVKCSSADNGTAFPDSISLKNVSMQTFPGIDATVCASGCSHTTLALAITGLGVTGGSILVLEDQVTTGLVIADNTSNLTIFSYDMKKITKSGVATSSRGIIIGDGSSNIVIKGFEWVNWDETSDVVFFAETTTDPTSFIISENKLNSFTQNHNFTIANDPYVYFSNLEL